MALRLRRGTNAQRLLITPTEGELVYTTDTKRLWVGDGSTVGGIVVNSGIAQSLNDLLDVDLTLPPLTGQILKFNGTAFVAAEEGAFTPGGDYHIDITNATDQIVVDSVTSNFYGTLNGNVIGNVTGDTDGTHIGSVEATDSTVLVNSTTKTLSTGILDISGFTVNSTSTALVFKHDNPAVTLNFIRTAPDGGFSAITTGISQGFLGPGESFRASRGTLAAPTILTVGDAIKIDVALGYDGVSIDGEGEPVYTLSSAIRHSVDYNVPAAAGEVPGSIQLLTFADSNPSAYKGLTIDSRGFTAINQPLEFFARAALDVNGSAVFDGEVEASAFKGSFFGDDSTVLVDGVNSILRTSTMSFSNSVIESSVPIRIQNTDPTRTTQIIRLCPDGDFVNITNGITQGFFGPGETFRSSRGTLSAPTAIQVGDTIKIDAALGYDGISLNGEGGPVYTLSSIILRSVDANAVVDEGEVPGSISLLTFTDGNPLNSKGVNIDSRGFTAINHAVGYAAEATLDINGFAKLAVLSVAPTSPVNGMVAVADGDSVSGWDPLGIGAPAKQQMVVYLGGSWRQIAVES